MRLDRSVGGCDWIAGVPACNAVASAASNLSALTSLSAFSCFALMQAGMPAVQSHSAILNPQNISYDLFLRLR